MRYWKQFAEMLGLQLGEEFSLTKFNGEKVNEDTYKITRDGLLYKSYIGINWYSEPSKTIYYLLKGEYKAVPIPWKPTCGESYWYYSEAFKKAISIKWQDEFNDFIFWKAGNCFRTEVAAITKGKELMETIKKEYKEA